jgi:uncharacterized protein YndB with AHSA1/START domain
MRFDTRKFAFGIDCVAVFDEVTARVFNIITIEEFIELWISNTRELASCRVDARAGGQMFIQGALCDRLLHTITGTVVRYSYPLCLLVHCQERSRPGDVQRIAITLRKVGRKMQLRVTHFGLRDIRDYRLVQIFWRRAICKMAILLQSKYCEAPHLVFQPRWLAAARRFEQPWIPHSTSFEPMVYAQRERRVWCHHPR